VLYINDPHSLGEPWADPTSPAGRMVLTVFKIRASAINCTELSGKGPERAFCFLL